jgi:hypothetical protein
MNILKPIIMHQNLREGGEDEEIKLPEVARILKKDTAMNYSCVICIKR